MRPYLLLTPGPLTTTDSVKEAMMSYWSTWDEDYNVGIVEQIRKQLVGLATSRPDEYTAVLMQGSGTFCVEATLGTAVRPSDKLLVAANGAYGKRMGVIADYYHIDCDVMRFEEPEAVDPARIDAYLTAHGEVTHVSVVHCETTTGVLNPLEEIASVVKRHGKVLIVDDERAFKNGLIDKSRTGSSTPNVWDEPQSRKRAAAAAVNGAWSTWFGRIGGTGNCPRYMYIRDVPARLKIAKLLPVWENLNGTPLSERKYENGVYSSPSAGMSDSAIWAKHPETGEVYFTFINMDGYVPVPQGFEIDEISALSGVFEKLEGMAPNETNKWGKKNPPLMEIKDGKIIPNNPGVINMPYCVEFKKAEEK